MSTSDGIGRSRARKDEQHQRQHNASERRSRRLAHRRDARDEAGSPPALELGPLRLAVRRRAAVQHLEQLEHARRKHVFRIAFATLGGCELVGVEA